MGWKCDNPQCSAVLPDGAKFCRRCGRKRPAPAPLKADTRHASTVYTGTGFPQVSESDGFFYEPPAPTQSRPPYRLWIFLLFILIMVIRALARL